MHVSSSRPPVAALPFALFTLGLAAWLTGCAEPRFRDSTDDAGSETVAPAQDAGVDSSAGQTGCRGAGCAVDAQLPADAQAPDEVLPAIDTDAGFIGPLETDAALGAKPEWALALEGTYAVRTRFYGAEEPTRLTPFTHELVHLVDIVYDSDSKRMTMDAALCDDHGEILTLRPASVRVVQPDKVAHRQFNVLYENGQFRTEAPPLLTGYTDELPEPCRSSEKTAPRRDDQRWISGATCQCPVSAAPPTLENDCRITDSDGDGSPGQTVQVTGAFEDTNYVRTRDLSQFKHGVIAANRKHVAQFERNEDFYVLRCAGGGPCPRNTLFFCASTEVLFEPLAPSAPSGSPWTCTDVRQQRDACALFGGCSKLVLPAGCN